MIRRRVLFAVVVMLVGLVVNNGLCESIDYTIFSPVNYQITHKDRILVKLNVSGVTDACVNGEKVAIEKGRIYHVVALPNSGENSVLIRLQGTDYVEEIPLVVFRKNTVSEEQKKLPVVSIKPATVPQIEKEEETASPVTDSDPVTLKTAGAMGIPVSSVERNEQRAVPSFDQVERSNRDIRFGIETVLNSLLQSKYNLGYHKIPFILDLCLSDKLSISVGYTSYGKEGNKMPDTTSEIGIKWYTANILGTAVGPMLSMSNSETYWYYSDGEQVERKSRFVSLGFAARRELFPYIYIKVEGDVVQFESRREKEWDTDYQTGQLYLYDSTSEDKVNITPEPRLSVLFYF